MYDYRQDLMTILENIGDTPAELARGQQILQAALNLIAAGEYPHHESKHPTSQSRHFKIKRHIGGANHETSFKQVKSTPTKPTPATQVPLTGHQYDALNKIKGLEPVLQGLVNQPKVAATKFAHLNQQMTKLLKDLSEEDQAALQPRLGQLKANFTRIKNQVKPNQPTPQPQAKAVKEKPISPATTETTNPMTEALVASQPKQPRAPFSSQKGQYVIQRQLVGADLLTENAQEAGHISETMVRKFNLQSGSIVKADIRPTDVFIHKAIRTIDHLGDLKFDDPAKIQTFDFGVVQKHKRHLRVTFNSNNEPLMVDGKKFAFLLPEDNLVAGKGSIVQLAWFTDDPDSMRIRWTYPTEEEKATAKAPTKKTSPSKKAESASSQPTEKRYPGIDLSGQTVAVLVGNRQEHESYEQIIRLYGGQPTIVNSFKTQKTYLKNKLKSADIVILIKSKAHHGASKAVNAFQQQFGFNFAVANTIAMGQFEDALYRAANGFPADTVGIANK